MVKTSGELQIRLLFRSKFLGVLLFLSSVNIIRPRIVIANLSKPFDIFTLVTHKGNYIIKETDDQVLLKSSYDVWKV